jgi:hypothetical protein
MEQEFEAWKEERRQKAKEGVDTAVLEHEAEILRAGVAERDIIKV